MHEHRPTVKIVLPNGDLLALLGQEVRFTFFYPDDVRAQLQPEEAQAMALVCLDRDGQEVARVRMSAILGYLFE